jgi:hypothetical protein
VSVSADVRHLIGQASSCFPGQSPLAAVLDGQVVGLIGAIHRENGVQSRPGEQVAGFEGAPTSGPGAREDRPCLAGIPMRRRPSRRPARSRC